MTAVETKIIIIIKKKLTRKVSEPRHDDTDSKQATQTRLSTCEKPVSAIKKHRLNTDTHSSNHGLRFSDPAQ